MDRMKTLIEKLNRASQAYYGGLPETMTDYEWDAMFDQLKRLEEESGVVLANSPTHTVSTALESGQKEAHEFPALSLAKTKLPEELVKWAENRPVWISWKLDGSTLVATYDNGKLTKVVTRGDGHVGTNITHLASAIAGFPPFISETGHLVIRGEVIIRYTDFEQFCLESDEKYANPRNLASGSLTLKDVAEVHRRKLRWIPFSLVYTERAIPSWGDRMDFLAQLGFTPVEREKADVPNLETISDKLAIWTEKVISRVNPYPVDGLVLTYDDTVYAGTGSVTGHHAARAGLAFKWEDASAETRLDHIEWSCAASTITPVAVFDPVELEGTTVKRASLCNISECERLGLGGEGSRLSVIKANKIIPKVIRVISAAGSFTIPDRCPVCDAKAEVFISEIAGTKTLRCTNPNCAAKQLKKFARFVSKQGVDMDGVSENTLARFISEGWIQDCADIYRLMAHRDEIALLDGFGEKSVQNLADAIARSRVVPDTHMLFALCIPLIGPDVANRLLSVYTWEELFETATRTEDAAIFSSIDGIGREKSASFVRWCHNAENMREVARLKQEVQIRETPKTAVGNKCLGLTFVITGDMHQYKNRAELKAYIASQGGKVTGAVSKSTSFLINNEITSNSEKNKRARQLGIPVISEQEFLEKFT